MSPGVDQKSMNIHQINPMNLKHRDIGYQISVVDHSCSSRFICCGQTPISIPVGSSQLRSRSSSPWGAWLFFFSLSKNDDRSLDFICRHARFYLDHKCEINSKRLDPPRSPQGYSLPKRTQGGVQPLEFYLTPISGQAPWFYLWKVGLIEFYFHPTWDLVPILYFQRFSPLILAPTYLDCSSNEI